MGKKVEEYYTEDYVEKKRHEDPFGYLQELRTREIICNVLKPGDSILDIGGANGVYSFYLADLGFDTSLLDITPLHVEEVKKENTKRKNRLTDVYLGDAIDFSIDKKFDLIIIHGPLYHITDRDLRLRMLKNVKIHLKEGGVVLGFGIHRYAGLFYGIHSGKLLEPEYKKVVLDEVKTGYRSSGPTWHFHLAEELAEEFREAGYIPEKVVNVTGQLWMLPNIEEYISSDNGLKEILDIIRELESETNIGQDLVCISHLPG